MDAGPMTCSAFVATGFAVALLTACASLTCDTSKPHDAAGIAAARARPCAHQSRPSTAVAQSTQVLPGAHDVAQRVTTFLSNAASTASFTPAVIGRAIGVTLGPDPNNDSGWAVYHSHDLGQGWTYWVQFAAGEAMMKPGFRFWFDHPNRKADAALVCALPLDQLRASLTSHGWVERSVPSEIGGILAIEFAKADMVLTLTPRDGADVHGIACVLSLQTADRRDRSSE